GAPSFPFPHPMKERSAEWRKVNTWHLAAPRALRSTHASRRSTCGVYNLGTVLPGPDGHSHATLSRQVSPPFIRTRPAIEGSPRSRADGDPRRPGAVVAKHQPQAPH